MSVCVFVCERERVREGKRDYMILVKNVIMNKSKQKVVYFTLG